MTAEAAVMAALESRPLTRGKPNFSRERERLTDRKLSIFMIEMAAMRNFRGGSELRMPKMSPG